MIVVSAPKKIGQIELSVVVPVFNEEGSVRPLYDNLKEVLNTIRKESEIIFVDDGSTDSTFNVLKDLSGNARIFRFPLNTGQHKAVEKGFHEARGKIIVTIDGDLQSDPNDIPKLLAKLDEGYDVVCGWRMDRKDRDPWLKIVESKIGNYILSRMTKLNLHDFSCGIRAFRKDVVEDLTLRERSEITFIPCILSRRTSRITEVKVRHRRRISGKSKYGFLIRVFNAIFCYIRLARNGRNFNKIR